MIIKENIFKQQSSKYHPTRVYKRKKIPGQKGGGGGQGPLGPPLIPLLLCSYPAFIPFGLIIDCRQTPRD